MLCPWASFIVVTYKAIIWDKTVKERKLVPVVFLEHTCLSRRVVYCGLCKQVRWAMQKGRLKENAVAQLWTSGKHQPQAGIRSGEVFWTEVHRLTEVSGQWAKHICVWDAFVPSTGQALGGWDMFLLPNSQKSQEEDTYRSNYQTHHAEGKPNCQLKEGIWKHSERQNQASLIQHPQQ